jgi:hypothetical protein
MPWSALELQRGVDSERSGTSAVSTVHAKTESAVCPARLAVVAARPLGLILILGLILFAGSLLSACGEGGSTTYQGAVIGTERGGTGIYSGQEWDIAKRNSY